MLRRIFGGGNSQVKVLPYGTEDNSEVATVKTSGKQTESKQKRRKSVPKIKPTSPVSTSYRGGFSQDNPVALTTEEVLCFLTQLQLDCTTTPLKRGREEDPRVKAFFSFSTVSTQEVAAGAPQFSDILTVLRYSYTTENKKQQQRDVQTQKKGQEKIPVKEEHAIFISSLCTLGAYLDISIDLIRGDVECLSPMSLANQAVALVDLLFEQVIFYMERGRASADEKDDKKVSKESPCISSKLPDIFRALHSLWSVIELVDVNSKVLWSQTLSRASSLLIACSSSQGHGSPCSCHDALYHLVTSVQPLSQCITVFRDICGFPVSTSVTMLFWPVCHHMQHCVARAFNAGVIRESVAKSLSSNIYRALSSTAPSPQELPALIHTLNTAYPSTGSTGSNGMTREEGRRRGSGSGECRSGVVSNLHQHKRRLSSASDGWSRVIFVLTGFQYLLHPSVEGGLLRQQLTRPAEWLTALGEALLISVAPEAPICLKQLAYTLAQYFFFVVMACQHHKPLSNMKDFEWIFSELSEHLQKFSTLFTKKQGYIARLQQVSSISQPKLSGRPPSSHSNSSYGNSNTNTNRKVNLSSRYSSPPPNDITFAIGDNIEGLCAVQNGSKRWFPGVISAVIEGPGAGVVSYNIVFNDGESKEGVLGSDVRPVRSRRRPGPSRNNSSLSLMSGNEELISLPEFGSVSVDHAYRQMQVVKPTPMPVARSNTTPPPVALQQQQQDREYRQQQQQEQQRLQSRQQQQQQQQSQMSSAPPMTEPLTDRFDPLDSLSIDEEVKMINSGDDLMENEEDEGDDDNDNVIFEIPLVLPCRTTDSPLANNANSANNSVAGESIYSAIHFDLPDNNSSNQISKLKPGIVVPRMSLDNLDYSGAALDRCVSTNSLSGALLREETTNVQSENNNQSPRTAIDKILHDIGMDDSSAVTRLDSWRDSVGWNTRRSTERPHFVNSTSANSLMSMAQNQLSQSHEIQRLLHLTTSDLSADLATMRKMNPAFEIIAAVLSLKTVLDLSMYEKETFFTSKRATKVNSQPDPYEDDAIKKNILNRPELNSGHCKLYMYAVREFLDSGVSDQQVPFLSMSASHVGPCYFRLLKLCSTRFFADSCLPGHLLETDKIGTGAFGSVHRVSCPEQCSQHRRCGGGSAGSVGRGDVEYAVKRMPRERSLQDEGVLFGVLTEVTCLEVMTSHRGVCDIVNYGVHGGQYWMVLELGMCNLQEWALEMINQEALLLSMRKNDQNGGDVQKLDTDSDAEAFEKLGRKSPECVSSGVDKLLLKLCIFHEMMSISHDVHKKNIIHFDIKCSNFMFRRSPQLEDFLQTVLYNTSSGVLFLTDFGEALQMSEDIDMKLKQRSRGTLSIQSPEMLSVSESGTGLANTMKLGVESAANEKLIVEINTPSAASDCWSISCSLFELMTGTPLFENQSFTEMFCLLCKEEFMLPDIASLLVAKGVQPTTLPVIPSCATALADLMKLGLVQSPLERPPLTTLMTHTADVIKSIIPFRSVPQSAGSHSGGLGSGGLLSIKKQESYSPFYHLANTSPFKLDEDAETGRKLDSGKDNERNEGRARRIVDPLASPVGILPGGQQLTSEYAVGGDTDKDDFLVVLNASCLAPPLARDLSRERSNTSTLSHHTHRGEGGGGGAVCCVDEKVQLTPGVWQFAAAVSLNISHSFTAHVVDTAIPVALDSVYGDMNAQINDVIKLQTLDDDAIRGGGGVKDDSIVLQSTLLASRNDMAIKTSLLHCLGRQFAHLAPELELPSPLLPSPLEHTKAPHTAKRCHINLYMAETDADLQLASSSSKSGIGGGVGIATSNIHSPSLHMTVPAMCESNTFHAMSLAETTYFETDNLCIFPCELSPDLSSTVDILKSAYKFAQMKAKDGFEVQVCLEASANQLLATSISNSTPTAAGAELDVIKGKDVEVGTLAEKMDISKPGFTAAVLLCTLLRQDCPLLSTSNSAASLLREAERSGESERGVNDSEGYLEKHFPWILGLVDRNLFRMLAGTLTDVQ